jgi:hypothetical protein
MEHKSEGVCRFCEQTFSGQAIGRHLLACKTKIAQDTEEAAKGKKHKILHLRISGGKYYWLNIEMPASATLLELDDFLRAIWVECCDHLSAFTIHGIEYQDSRGAGDFGGIWGTGSQSLNKKLGDVLRVKDKFEYEYDFGSTTELEGKVLGEREGFLKDKVKILARNNPYLFECEECGKEATDLCMDCESFFCEDCLEGEEHECGEEMALPVANSPRMGVCGYDGSYYKDTFMQDEQIK